MDAPHQIFYVECYILGIISIKHNTLYFHDYHILFYFHPTILRIYHPTVGVIIYIHLTNVFFHWVKVLSYLSSYHYHQSFIVVHWVYIILQIKFFSSWRFVFVFVKVINIIRNLPYRYILIHSIIIYHCLIDSRKI